jgi:UDP-N-acetylmuramyl pentapeptide phosphotransferase/UDP-N-acetylglucosamine-1-phosphate transferase
MARSRLLRFITGALAGPAGGKVARAAVRALADNPALERTNFRGRRVSLAGGPALALGATAGAVVHRPERAAATVIAGLGSGAVGLYDDLVGGRPEHAAKGFRGHLGALRQGRVTSGLVKIAGVGAAGLAAAALLPRRRAADVLLGAGVIAGSANLFNLLDLRPGRALKAGLLVGTPLGASGPIGAATALLPADLNEEIMLGDAGANALGALLGTAYVARTGTFGRLAALAGIVALTAASEKVSFTRVIENHPLLNRLDQWGRRGPDEPETPEEPEVPKPVRKPSPYPRG